MFCAVILWAGEGGGGLGFVEWPGGVNQEGFALASRCASCIIQQAVAAVEPDRTGICSIKLAEMLGREMCREN